MLSIVRIDGDRFKFINDTFGHEAGDAVLARIGEVLRSQTRGSDFPTRVGGDEFSILLDRQHTKEDTDALLSRIRENLKKPLFFDGNPCQVQISCGIATVDTRHESPEQLLSFADAALYNAKQTGRNQSTRFDQKMRQNIESTRGLVGDLHAAIERRQFIPFFQAQIDMRTGDVWGLETLARWEHPERGIIAAGDFIETADKLRMTSEIDCQIMRKVHQEFLRLRAESGQEPPRISFNAGLGRLSSFELIEQCAAMRDDGLQISIELLETTMLEDLGEIAKANIERLQELDVQLEIDDFGTGHTSILGLLEIKPDAIKIDRRLVRDVAVSASGQQILRAIIEIAQALDISLIAEGVETKDQAKKLLELGCPIMQGYYFGHPFHWSDLPGFLGRQPAVVKA